MSHNCEYVRKHYQVPAEIGRRVIAYGKPGVAETLPLKEWQVLPFKHDWDDLDWNREAREDLVRVWAATRGQAKYKAYEQLQDYCHSIKAMLHFKVRRA
ncbi:hypothetical protein HU765_20255 [Pseudomonas sp. SWRI81]|uniref:hypothetical protein n=1 Tax=Pseudomonas sp. SWRI81 TaxID=2745505 RepID=UPI0016444B0A|nr:hypothetical protein [Pseudomonas sp. SWRI81]MBC3272274.1 hypothetical protein [Pseudomonas sp. SWRI81]